MTVYFSMQAALCFYVVWVHIAERLLDGGKLNERSRLRRHPPFSKIAKRFALSGRFALCSMSFHVTCRGLSPIVTVQ